MPALVKTLAYNEARLRMIAENVANIHTPGYRTKQLDVRGFQSSLRRALDARGGDASQNHDGNTGNACCAHASLGPARTPIANGDSR